MIVRTPFSGSVTLVDLQSINNVITQFVKALVAC